MCLCRRSFDPRSRLGLPQLSCRDLSADAAAFYSAHLIEDDRGLLGQFGPSCRRVLFTAHLEHPVCNEDLVASQIGSSASPAPRWKAGGSVQGGFNRQGVVAPHRLSRR